jgi:hypothetical protein
VSLNVSAVFDDAVFEDMDPAWQDPAADGAAINGAEEDTVIPRMASVFDLRWAYPSRPLPFWCRLVIRYHR